MRASQPSANGAMLNAPPQSHKCPVQNSERTEISRLRRTFSRTGLLNYVVEQVCYKSTNGLKWHSDDRGVVGVEDETDEITTIVFGASLFHIVMLVVIMLAVCVSDNAGESVLGFAPVCDANNAAVLPGATDTTFQVRMLVEYSSTSRLWGELLVTVPA